MLNTYWLFVGEFGGPDKGIESVHSIYSTLENAKAQGQQLRDSGDVDWVQVVTVELGHPTKVIWLAEDWYEMQIIRKSVSYLAE